MVRFGIIGAGVISKKHAEGIEKVPNAEIAAVCDIIQEKADAFAQKYKVKKVYTDYRQLLQDPDIDAVSICTPSGLHGEMVIAAARAGKHVLCEKPIEITREKIDQMIAEVEKSDVKVGCVFQRRFQEWPKRTKAALESGEFGRVLMASAYLKYYRTPEYYKSAGWRATWEYDGGGCLMNQGVHGIDLISWLMGGMKRVTAITRTQLHDIPVEDAAVAVAEYNNGAIGVIEASTCVNPAQSTRFEIHCEKGSICFDDEGLIRWYLNGKEYKDEFQVEDISLAPKDDPGNISADGHCLLIADLAASIENDTQPAITPREGRKAVDAILAIYQSSAENREILL